MRTLRLLVRVGAGLSLSDFSEVDNVSGTLEGNMSSMKVCQTMLGGLLMMLKRANLRMGERLREKGVYDHISMVPF